MLDIASKVVSLLWIAIMRGKYYRTGKKHYLYNWNNELWGIRMGA